MKFAGMRLAFFTLSVLSTAVLALPEPGRAQDQPKPDAGKPALIPGIAAGGKSFKQPYGMHLEPILKTIKANDDQRKKITAIVNNYKPKIQPLREQYNLKREEFLKSICDGKEAEVVMSQQVELGRLYSDITSQYTFMRLEIRKFLSPDQILLMEKYRKQQGWSR
jgi:hypothetical protein